jgi:hypothetical protein
MGSSISAKLVMSPIKPESIVQSSARKYFALPVGQIIFITSRHPASIRGAFRDRHERWVRDAMDAGGAFDESAVLRTAKPCGPDAPTLASTPKKLTLLRGMVTTSPVHQGERGISR